MIRPGAFETEGFTLHMRKLQIARNFESIYHLALHVQACSIRYKGSQPV